MIKDNTKWKKGKIWTSIGKIIYFVGWPAIWLIINLSPQRTRILVLSEGKLLLTKDWIGPGKWSIPGGGLHVGEDHVEGAIRELKEETGIRLNKNELQKLGTLKTHNNGIRSKLIIYKAEFIKRPKISLSGLEILDYVWVGNAEIKKINIDKSTARIINSFPTASNLLQ